MSLVNKVFIGSYKQDFQKKCASILVKMLHSVNSFSFKFLMIKMLLRIESVKLIDLVA